MRTVIIILAGFIILAIAAFAARQFGGDKAMSLAALVFIPLWLAAALINMWIGVTRAGYSVGEELPIMLLIFAPPAALAGFLWWKFS
jgi:hypothetical protein